ncbi:MAG TPA: family 43 glycosylhydrolase [Pyrinomonadaceae bacterium]|nr:family 43 glycosylhydrolase [Pyrinomonadaceae bacterium]
MKPRLTKFVACTLLLSIFYLPARARQATYRNPVVAGDYPDPSVMRVEDEYWAATTTGDWTPHFALLRSRDLVNWQKVGYVFQTRPAWAKGDFWAPELVSDRGRFFVFYVARRDEGPKKRGTLCVAVATAAAPAGPYDDRGPLVCQIPERGGVGSIDPAFVRDERGQPFLIWKADGNDARPMQPTSLYAQPLSEDGTRLLGKRKEILRNDAPWEGRVTEGSFILRRGEWFYHFYAGNACCGRSCDYAVGVARSRQLLGPWEKYARNPIIEANRDWQCPGHGSIVETSDGRDFFLYHSYRQRPDTFSIGREALLDEVKWSADGWPIIDEGRGPSSVAPSPFGVEGGANGSEFFDGFVDARLSPEWQWPMTNEQTARVEVAGGGHLVLEPSNAAGDALTGAVVARRTTSGDYVATVLVDARGMATGVRAGLAVYGWRDACIGIAAGGGKVSVWRREGKDERVVASTDAPKSDAIYLRMTAAGGERYSFAFGANGREWTNLGGAVGGGYIESARVALTAVGGAARFDWVKIISGNGK